VYHKALALKPTGGEALTGLGYAQLDRGKTAQAGALFNQVLEREHTNAPALFGLGEVYREQGRRDFAVQTFRQYLKLKPSGRDADIARRQIQQLTSR
jgi:cytochrome c-type biogenesis protein CcmH/NrfG